MKGTSSNKIISELIIYFVDLLFCMLVFISMIDIEMYVIRYGIDRNVKHFLLKVQNEFKKAWRRYSLQRSGSSRWRSTFTSRTKSWKDHRGSDTNGVGARGDKIRPNEHEEPSSPTSIRSPMTQNSFAYDLKSNQTVTNQDIEINENTPWLNNNHTAYVEQHVPPFDQADERL